PWTTTDVPWSPPIASIPMRGIEAVMSESRPGSLGGRLNDLFAVVEAAIGADAMRLLRAAAVAAGMKAGFRELPVGAALAPPGARVSPLGYCHRSNPPVRDLSGSRQRMAWCSQGPRLRSAPHVGQSPLQTSLQC